MKLRIKGNSLRLRVSRSEVERFSMGESIEDTIYFGPEPGARLTYALESEGAIEQTTVKYHKRKVTIQIPLASARGWAAGDSVGLSGSVDLGSAGTLHVLVEKDFACLDGSDLGNEDTFPHPQRQCSGQN